MGAGELAGDTADSPFMVSALGIRTATYFSTQPVPIVFSVMDGMNALFSGSCETVLLIHALVRNPGRSRRPPADGVTAAAVRRMQAHAVPPDPESTHMAQGFGYPAWASRYLYEHPGGDKGMGYVAVNGRTGAMQNPLAVMREPMTLDDYFASRMVREPLRLLDMDVPVAGADAFVLTTTERARDLVEVPVLIHAASTGMVDWRADDQLPGLRCNGQQVAVNHIREKSDIWAPEVDLFFAYDGFTILSLLWMEAVGWCGPGEATEFIEEHWDDEQQRILIGGKIPLNPHGGSLSEGGTQGSGHLREAVMQLRDDAGERQVPGATTAMLTIGGLMFNSQCLVLRADG